MQVMSEKPRRIRAEPSPVCPTHGCPMRVRTVRNGMRWWYCPHTTCGYSKKQSTTTSLYVERVERIDHEPHT